MNKTKLLIQKKITLFKDLAKSMDKEVIKSDAGNLYFNLTEKTDGKIIEVYSPWSVNKKNISKLYSKRLTRHDFSQGVPSHFYL